MSTTRTTHTHRDAILIRHATDADRGVLADLATLDDRAPLTGAVLIAEVDGVPRVALDLDDGSIAADPFARTTELVELLRLHTGGARAARGTLRGRLSSLLRPMSVRA